MTSKEVDILIRRAVSTPKDTVSEEANWTQLEKTVSGGKSFSLHINFPYH